MRVTCWLAHFKMFLITVKKMSAIGKDGKVNQDPESKWQFFGVPCLRGGES